jgi:hypothetical protein
MTPVKLRMLHRFSLILQSKMNWTFQDMAKIEGDFKRIVDETFPDVAYRSIDAQKSKTTIDNKASLQKITNRTSWSRGAYFRDLTGERVGKLTVQRQSAMCTPAGHRLWECLCECGRTAYRGAWAFQPSESHKFHACDFCISQAKAQRMRDWHKQARTRLTGQA